MKRIVIGTVVWMIAGAAMAQIHSETVEYRVGDLVMEGYLAYDSGRVNQGVRPGVLVVHEWKGLDEYTRGRVRQLAELGYVAFAVDIYGKGVRPEGREAAGTEARKYYADRGLFRERLRAGFDVLVNHPASDDRRMAAIGYCFGGAGVLELARTGAPVDGVVSFHGNLGTPTPEDARNITGRVLVCHGAADPNVPTEQVQAFMAEMDSAGVDWTLIAYGGAVHGFTNPNNTGDPSTGVAYQAEADSRSWEHMKVFFEEIFR